MQDKNGYYFLTMRSRDRDIRKYRSAAAELRLLHEALEAALARCKAQAHQDMREVAPGLWLHNRYASLTECLNSLHLPA